MKMLVNTVKNLNAITYTERTFYFHSTEFVLRENGNLVNTKSGYCVRPVQGRAVAGAQLEMATMGCHVFEFTSKGSIRHKSSKLCIQTPKKVFFLAYLLCC